MTDRTTTFPRFRSRQRGQEPYFIANAVTLGIYALVQLESGFLNHWDETGQFLGVLIGGSHNFNADGAVVGSTSLTPVPRGIVDETGLIIEHLASVGGTPTQAKVGDLVYSADSDLDSLTLTDTTNPPVGWLKHFRSATDVDVQLFTPDEWKAGIADATWNS